MPLLPLSSLLRSPAARCVADGRLALHSCWLRHVLSRVVVMLQDSRSGPGHAGPRAPTRHGQAARRCYLPGAAVQLVDPAVHLVAPDDQAVIVSRWLQQREQLRRDLRERGPQVWIPIQARTAQICQRLHEGAGRPLQLDRPLQDADYHLHCRGGGGGQT